MGRAPCRQLETYDRLVSLVYAAGHDPPRWPDAIGALDAHLDGAQI
jgi:hypothetical protein